MAETMLGTLTIGQAPREDVTPILDRYIPASVARIHRGLLDGFSREEIAAAAMSISWLAPVAEPATTVCAEIATPTTGASVATAGCRMLLR